MSVKHNNIMMIGSAERNVGKTLLACELIRRLKPQTSIIAVKVTTIREKNAPCPHGDEGCGLCGAFKGNFTLTQEHDGPPDKDTRRLIDAGSLKVFWLRVREAHLASGVEALLNIVPAGQATILESNSARQMLEPSLFLVLRQDGGSRIKESCRQVIDQADRILSFNGTGWDLSPDRISYSAGRWWMRQDATAIILAGGRSLRMGQDKNFLPVAGRPMIQNIVEQLSPWFNDILIGANDPEKFQFLQRRIIPDRQPGMGPLMGILSCLSESRSELNFITACDVPVFDPHFLMKMIQAAHGSDITVPLSPDGRPEPLLAVYRKSVAAAAEQVLQNGGRRISDLFKVVKVKFVDVSGLDWYRNINTMDEYRSAIAGQLTGEHR
ncbi:MAG: molybdenum cofactor guanylyltransferase [bacterium]